MIMRKFSKLAALLLVLAMLFSLAACTEDPSVGTGSTTTAGGETTAEPEAPTTAPKSTTEPEQPTEPPTSTREPETTGGGGGAIEPPAVLSLAELVAAMSNYTAILAYNNGYEDVTETYNYNNGIFKYTIFGDDVNYNEYIQIGADGKKIYYSDYLADFDTYFTIKEDSPYYASFDYFYFGGLEGLKTATYTVSEDGTVYTLTGTADQINALAKSILYDADGEYEDYYYGAYTVKEVFDSITVTAANGKIKKIVLHSEYFEDNVSYGEYTYTLNFSAVGTTAALTLPQKTIVMTDEVYEQYFGSGSGGGGSEGGDTTPDVPVENGNLSALVNAMTSYTALFSYTDGESTYMETYKYSGSILHYLLEQEGATYNEYIQFGADGKKTYYSDWLADFGTYFTIDGDSSYYSTFDYFSFNGLEALKTANFEADDTGTLYTLTGDAANRVGKALLYDADMDYMGYLIEEVFESITVTVANGKIIKIVLVSDYLIDGVSYGAYTYTLTFTEIGTTAAIALPQSTIAMTDAVYKQYFEESSGEGGGTEGGGTDTPVENGNLSEIVSGMTNYTGSLSYSDGVNDITEVYKFHNGTLNFSFTQDGVTYNDYIKLLDGRMTYYSDFVVDYNTFFVIEDTSAYWYDFDFFYFHGLDALGTATFTVSADGTTYTLTGDAANRVAKAVFYDADGDYYDETYGAYTVKEVFSSITVTVADGKITKIVAVSEYFEDGQSYGEYDYTITFSACGTTAPVSLPTNTTVLTDEAFDQYFGTGSGGGNEGGGTEGGNQGGTDNPSQGGNGDDTVYDDFEYKGIQPVGSTTALVIPVQFSGDSFTAAELAMLRTAFSGTAAETGWQSVKSFYSESSGGKLTLDFEFLPTYTSSMTPAAFEKSYNDYYANYYAQTGLDVVDELIAAILAANDAAYDYSKYDSNNDGLIDAIYLIYSFDVDYEGNSDLWWAWTTLSYVETEYDRKMAGYFVWCGIDTLTEDVLPEDHTYFGDPAIRVTINAVTLIHETGHLLNLDDYYDYDTTTGSSGGLGGGDMMDNNVGDHGSFTKTILGWITPKEVTESVTLTIGGLSATGDCIILRKDPGSTGYNCEYLLIDLYLPTGINALTDGACGLPEGAAVRIFHVNATLGEYLDAEGYRHYGYLRNNAYTAQKLISVVERDNNNSISSTTNYASGEYADMNDYYTAGTSMPAGYKWQDGTAVQYTVEIVSINAENGTAEIKITFKN